MYERRVSLSNGESSARIVAGAADLLINSMEASMNLDRLIAELENRRAEAVARGYDLDDLVVVIDLSAANRGLDWIEVDSSEFFERELGVDLKLIGG